jgi:natural resistance-associated macrophage protein 2
VDAFLFLFIDRLGARRLEAFFAVLIGVMAVSFGYIFLCVTHGRYVLMHLLCCQLCAHCMQVVSP